MGSLISFYVCFFFDFYVGQVVQCGWIVRRMQSDRCRSECKVTAELLIKRLHSRLSAEPVTFPLPPQFTLQCAGINDKCCCCNRSSNLISSGPDLIGNQSSRMTCSRRPKRHLRMTVDDRAGTDGWLDHGHWLLASDQSMKVGPCVDGILKMIHPTTWRRNSSF